MLSRRLFSACAICSAIGGFVASKAEAQTAGGAAPAAGATGGVTRNVISKTDLPDGKYTTILVTAEIAPGALVAKHTHPGVESAYVIEGEGELIVEGQPSRAFKGSDSFQIPVGAVHASRTAARPRSSRSPTRWRRTSRWPRPPRRSALRVPRTSAAGRSPAGAARRTGCDGSGAPHDCTRRCAVRAGALPT
jgi:quercetin dioxygenase-like cupin family protein